MPGLLATTALFCAGPVAVMSPTPPPQATATAYPTPPPPEESPGRPPGDSELEALIQYANDLHPWLLEAGEIIDRDGDILKEAEGGNDQVLCDGRLKADNGSMKGVLNQIAFLAPPTEAEVIHELLLESGDAWTEALDNVELFCETGNQLHKVPAFVKFWEAAAKLQDAGNRFWLLLVAQGIEDWVQR
jgi:hypothetical protein